LREGGREKKGRKGEKRKEKRKEGRKNGRKEERKKGRKEGKSQHTSTGRCCPGIAATPVIKSFVTNGLITIER